MSTVNSSNMLRLKRVGNQVAPAPASAAYEEDRISADVREVEAFFRRPRWEHTKRTYSAFDVARFRSSVKRNYAGTQASLCSSPACYPVGNTPALRFPRRMMPEPCPHRDLHFGEAVDASDEASC